MPGAAQLTAPPRERHQNANVAPTLGRSLAAGSAATESINLVEPGTMYGKRLNQLDVRAARTSSIGRTTTTLNLDIYNALNVDTPLSWDFVTFVTSVAFVVTGVSESPAR